ncbi:hypothetical protein M0R45_014677 [Rubus argutus]|uniref:EF-hand domain-containing protein n=1 Tax=Rubus argutus TaxID=59490 RepID=A0AAW1XMY7_RUBAR
MNVRLFCTIDEDEDGQISRLELRALIIGIRFDEIELDKDDAVDKVMKDFDTNLSNTISPIEFIDGVSKWLREAKHAGDFTSNSGGDTMKFLSDFHAKTKEEHDRLRADDDQSDEDVEGVDNPKRTSIKAGLMLLAGTIIAAALLIPRGCIWIIFASRKKKRTTSLTFSELYGAVTMNNVLCLAVFLALRTHHLPSLDVFYRYLLYPFSLVLVYVLDYIFGWS